MANSPMLSVIIPVYNVRKEFLSECFESILAQTFRDFEMIVVDDGAADDLREYMDSYDWKNTRVSVIHQENRGVAAARNVGLETASGKYVTFVDSDDTIDPECFANVVDYAEKNGLEVLMWGLNLDQAGSRKEFSPYRADIPHFSKEQKEEVQFKTLVGILPFYVCPPASADASGSACAKLYLKDFLRKNELRYTQGLKRAEDMEFNLRVLHFAEHIGYLYKLYYNYRQLETSATFSYRDGGIDVFTGSLNAIKKHLSESGKSDLYFQVYYMRCMFFFLESMDMDYLNPNNPKPFRERIRAMAHQAVKDPYAEAFENLRGDYLTFARKIPLFLIRRNMFTTLALFYATYRKFTH